jgi:hypothetical protein
MDGLIFQPELDVRDNSFISEKKIEVSFILALYTRSITSCTQMERR